MIICHCMKINDKQIRECIENHNIETLDDLHEFCAAGQGCGGCMGAICEIIEQCSSCEHKETCKVIDLKRKDDFDVVVRRRG